MKSQRLSQSVRTDAGKTGGSAKPLAHTPASIVRLQRAIGNQAIIRLMRSGELEAAPVSSPHMVPGRPLESSIRGYFEPRLGRDLSAVRIHTDALAARSAHSIDALAYTAGHDIVFGEGKYAPDTSAGRRLIAHELAHTLKPRPGLVTRAVSPDYPKMTTKLSYDTLDWVVTEAEAHDVLVLLSGLTPTDLADTLAKLETDGLAGRLLENMSAADRAAYSSLFVAIWQARVPPHPSLAVQAEARGLDAVSMSSYSSYQSKTWKWFFSPSSTLEGRASKPATFATWADWNAMHWQSQQVIADLAGLDPTRLNHNAANLATLRAAYATWPASQFAVFQSGTSATNTCNVFLGDTLFMDGKNQTKDGKYYSAGEVYAGTDAFTEIPREAVVRGDIVAWSYGHVEVVTSVNHALDEFCSRGGYRTPMGGEKCAGTDRKISKTNLKFVRIK